MKRIASLLLAVVLVLAMLPVTAQAATDPLMDDEDMILDYGASDNDVAAQGVELMAAASEQTYEMANIPKNGTYQTMSTSQKMIDVIKDFEGFRSKAYWDNTQWTVGYGTRAANGNVTVTVIIFPAVEGMVKVASGVGVKNRVFSPLVTPLGIYKSYLPYTTFSPSI